MRTNHIFIMLNMALFVDTLLYGVIVPIVPFYATQLGISTTQLGWVFAAYSLAMLAVSTPLGRAVDAYGYKRVMTGGMVVLTLATSAFMLSRSLPLLLLSRLLQGAAAAATWAAALALVAAIFPSEVKGQKMGLAMTVTGVGTIVGPVFGGFLYQAAGYAAPFVVIIVLGAVLSVLFHFSPLPGKSTAANKEKPNLLALLTHRNIFWAMFISVLGSFGFAMLEPLLPIDLEQRFGVSSAGIGVLFGVLSLTYTVGQPYFGTLSDRIGRKPLILIGLIGTATVMPGLSLAPRLWLVGVFMGLLGLTSGAFSTPNLPLLAESTEAAFSENKRSSPSTHPAPDAEKGDEQKLEPIDSPYGAAFGIFNTVYSLGLVAGPLAGTYLAQHFGLNTVFVLFSFLLLVAAVGSYLGVRETVVRG